MKQNLFLMTDLPINLTYKIQLSIFIIFSALSFFIPFLLGYPQWLVGTIVNTTLFLSSIFLPKKLYLPIIIFPSLGVLVRGFIFGPFTPFLIYFLPFIWLGNLILIVMFKKIFEGEKSLKIKNKLIDFTNIKYVFAVFCAATAKFLFLLIISNIYLGMGMVPKMFVSIMGLNQLATALSGGLISFLIFYIYEQYNSRSSRTA